MKKGTKIIVMLLGICTWADSVMAVDYYIDSTHGRDSNSGRSAQLAWQTLEKVNLMVFKPGDKVLFKAGTRYQGQLKPQGSGSLIDGINHSIVVDRYSNRNQWYPNLNMVIRRNLIEQVPGDGIVPNACDSALVEHNTREKSAYRVKEKSPCMAVGVQIQDNGGQDLLGGQLPADTPPTLGAFEHDALLGSCL